MKGSRSTCLLCRRLAANSHGAGSRAGKWQTHASRFSTTATSRSDDPTIASTTPTSNAPLPSEVAVDTSGLGKTRRVVQNDHMSTSNIKLIQNKSRKVSAGDSARVDALFQQIVHKQTADKDAPARAKQTNPNMDPNMDLALVQAIRKLELMVEKDESEADAYAYLKSEIYPLLQEPGVTTPNIFYKVVSRMMEKVVAAKKKSMRSLELPTVADIFRVYTDIGDMNPPRWAALVGELVQKIIEIDPSAEEHDPAIVEGGLATRDAMLADLVESWKVLSLPKTTPMAPNDELTDGFWFPRIDRFSLNKFSGRGNFPAALSSIFPQYSPHYLGAPVAILAIATYALLLDVQRSNLSVRQSAARFVSKIAYLISFVNFQDEALQKLSSTSPVIGDYVMARWPDIKAQLKDRIESMATSAANAEFNKPSYSASHGRINLAYTKTNLNHAYLTRNTSELDKTWQSFAGSEKDISLEKAAELRTFPDLFDFFIHARMALNQPDHAIAALNTLRKVGLRPTMKTWNSMLDGCKKARNLNGIKNVWAKLAGSGMKLDTKLWTTRIAGLIECGDFEGGIRALEEMTKLWNSSSKDENTTAVEPTIEPVNAALNGLVRQNQVPAAESLLAWAGRQGIKPDIFTYNILLGRFVREGRTEDVQRVFTMMQAAGVPADEGTFTAVLNGAFTTIDPDDVEGQTRTVINMLDRMKAVGLEPNLQTYGKIIYGLLQNGDQTSNGIKAVLAHLWGNDYELSPQIYTMLVEYYFSRNPPDLDAVDSLLRRRLVLKYGNVEDNVLNDRIIKGYALAGQPSKALEYYYKISAAGATVILPTQIELLHSLLRDGRVDDARDMVTNTRRLFEESDSASDQAESARFWGHRFWQLAFSNGLIQEEDATAIAAAAARASSQIGET
ncbi:hypothetical protein F4813DRAFT_190366 [Daldinia decipiens]|uniref:uncharacterized protein n=1 Tax=Daldinia decipiens TaxID=326647 RepID=UPI0020C476F3|nr:uncharacterized protein F4813DRAFT_190366 [Daldinia decipiens]KAI1655118.1 hypothetical protein F4813DRAFT_190366 [Daldinia decipiens]